MQGHTRAQEHKSTRAGAVLIIALWILSMLVLLAISIGWRTSIELRLLKYHLSRSQAFHLARAAIERIYAEKNIDKTGNYDTIDEDWSNKLNSSGEPIFNDFPLGNGRFTLKYNQAGADYYGMQDEASKLNINKILGDDSKPIEARKKEFQNLIEKVLNNPNSETSETMVTSFTDWIDQDNTDVTFHNGEIQAKNSALDRLEELTMVEGFSIEDISKLSDYITIYGDGSININTAPREVLVSLGFSESEADDTIKLRNGDDGKPATSDDVKFKSAEEFKNTKILEDNNSRDAIINRLCPAGAYYSANAQAEVSGVKKEISAVIHFTKDTAPEYLYWYED